MPSPLPKALTSAVLALSFSQAIAQAKTALQPTNPSEHLAQSALQTGKTASPATVKNLSLPSPALTLRDWKSFDLYAESILKDWHIPGAAIAIVQNSKIIHSAGYGVRVINNPEKITPETVFAIGSCTKAFTALTLAQLIEEGKLSYDTKVATILPKLALKDPYITATLNVRDLLSMRTGLLRTPCEIMLTLSDYNPEDVFPRMQFVPMQMPFRTGMTYINQMYVAAGEIVHNITGKPWTEVLSEKILVPLQMKNTYAVRPNFKPEDNYARPHSYLNKEIIVVPSTNCSKFAAAGSINSTVLDMSQWLIMQLNKGKYEGVQLAKTETIEELHYPVINYGAQAERRNELCAIKEADAKKFAYAMGWATMEYHNRSMLFHSGGIDGMRSQIALMPSENLGVIVLTNGAYGDGKPADVLKLAALDLVLAKKNTKEKQVNWNNIFLPIQLKADQEEQAKAEKKKAARVANSKPSLPCAQYAGVYWNETYDKIIVSQEGLSLVAKFNAPDSRAVLSHWHYDTFLAKFDNPTMGEAYLTFRLNEDAEPAYLNMDDIGEFKKLDLEPAKPATSSGLKDTKSK
jgi:CubicO group peptidase (beta-lactamase class C family)